MRRFSALLAALAATFAVTSAQALVIVVDDFNLPAAPSGTTVFDTVGGDATAATNTSIYRTVRHVMTTTGSNTTGIQSAVTVGGDSIPQGTLDVKNATNVTSDVTLEWTLASFLPLPTDTPVYLYFKVYSSDAVIKNIGATFGATTFGGFSIGEVLESSGGQTFSFLLTNSMISSLNSGGGAFALNLTGNNGWDITLDEVGFTIPEPSALALAGLALIGAGVASRRRA